MKNYILSYWIGANDDEGKFHEIECLISDDTRSKILTDKPPKFIPIIVDDGEEMILVTANINYVKQVFVKENILTNF